MAPVKSLRALARRSRKPDPYNLRDQAGPAWERRSVEAAALLREVAGPSLPAPVRVADIGCGNQRLGAALAVQFGAARIDYQGFDIHPQAAGVVPLDVRAAAPPGNWDVVATLGVLEYIDDSATVLARLAACAPWYVVSHVVSDSGHVGESDRQRYGWVGVPSAAEEAARFDAAGFSVAGHRLLDGGRTGLWICRSHRWSAPDDV